MELSRAYAYIPLDVNHYDAAELSMYYMQHGSPLSCDVASNASTHHITCIYTEIVQHHMGLCG